MEQLAAIERGATVDVLCVLAEIDRRAISGRRGCSDLFDYCVRRLRMSRGSAYRRIHAARAAARHHEIYAYLREGEISLCVVAMIVRALGTEAIEAIRACRGKSARDAEVWLASRKPPEPASPDKIVVRPPIAQAETFAALERDRTGACGGTESESPVQMPVPPPAYEYTFTATAELHEAIERLKDVLWRRVPFRNLDGVLKIAVAEFLERNDPALPRTAARPAKPDAQASRLIPAAIRNSVWARDGGRCVFVFEGRRCAARRGLEIDHVVPFSAGGRSDVASNLRLLCREHNQLERRERLGEGRLFADDG